MANISNMLNNIKNAIYGKDVRGSIHDGIDAINKETENTTNRQTTLEGRQNTLDTKFEEQIKNMTLTDPSSAEIVAMRTDKDGVTHDLAGKRIDKIETQMDDIATSMISTARFQTLQNAINYAKLNNIRKVYVDRDFNEEILLDSNIELISYGNTVNRLLCKGSKGDEISYLNIRNNYIETSSLVAGDLVLIDHIGVKRELNKILYVDGGKAHLENDLLFEYTDKNNTKVIKINSKRNISISGLNVNFMHFEFVDMLSIRNVNINHKTHILMSYDIEINNLSIDGEKDVESRVDIYASCRKANINNLKLKGGNTESDNSLFKLNQVADFNISNIISSSSYKPKNVYGYDGYFHSFMIDGAISETLDYIGDTVGYPSFPSKNINIDNVVCSGNNNLYHTIFVTVAENINISNVINSNNITLKDFNKVTLDKADINELLLEGNKLNLNISNTRIKSLSQLNNINYVNFINTTIDGIVGNNQNSKNIRYTNCNLNYGLFQIDCNDIYGWKLINCYVKKILARGNRDVHATLINCITEGIDVNGTNYIQCTNLTYNFLGERASVQSCNNVVIDGMIFSELQVPSDLIQNLGGLGYNTDISLIKDKKYRVSSWQISYNDLDYWQSQKFFKYKDIVENRDPQSGQPSHWMCVNNDGILKALNTIS